MRKLLAASFIALLTLPVIGWAVGLGDIQVRSALNQPLDASIPIADLGSMPIQGVTAKLAPPDQFTSVGLIRDPNLSALQFNVQLDKQQQPIVSVTSVQPIAQPVLTFLLQLSWSGGQLMREYTVFLDPASYGAPVQPKAQPITPTKVQTPQPSSNKTAATYGPTVPQDNLWEIAQDHKADASVTVPQNMLAILNLNPRAFSSNNINGLKSGYILTLPTKQQALSVSPDEAQAQLNQQNIVWQNRTGTTVLPTASTPDTSATDESAPVDTDNTADTSAPASAPDFSDLNSSSSAEQTEVLQSNNALASDNSTPSANKAASIQTLQNELAMATEAMQATEQANQVLQQSVKDLEQQVTKLQTELAAKNREISILEKLVADAGEQHHPAASSAVTTPVASSTLVNAPPNAAGHRLLYLTLLLIVLIAASIAAGILLPWRQFLTQLTAIKFARRQVKVDAAAEVPEAAEVVESVKEPVTAPPAPTPSVIQEEHPSKIKPVIISTTHTTVEPSEPSPQTISVLEEADVYIAYGRYQKAESLLLGSLKQMPKQPAIMMKLLEVYTAEGQHEKFDEMTHQLPPVSELPEALQASLGKLLERWNKYQATPPVAEPAPIVSNSTVVIKVETAKSESHAENNVIEFDGDWGLPPATAVTEEAVEPALDNDLEIALNTLSLALEEAKPPISPPPAPTPVATVAEVAPAASNLQTRLDLAKAYYDMGDFVEALGILQEILQAGSPEQQHVAQTLIDEINHK